MKKITDLLLIAIIFLSTALQVSAQKKDTIQDVIKQAEEGKELVVRLAEMEGKETTVRLQVPVAIQSAQRLNLVELPMENVARPTVSGNSISVKIRAHEIVTLGITPK